MGYASLTRHLDAPPEAVYAYITDPQRLTTWMTLFGGVVTTDETLDAVGARFDADLTVGSRHVGSVWEVTKADAPRIVHLHGRDDHGGTSVVWIAIGAWEGGTEFELEVSYELGGGLGATIADHAVIHRKVGQELKRSLGRLAERMADATPAPAGIT